MERVFKSEPGLVDPVLSHVGAESGVEDEGSPERENRPVSAGQGEGTEGVNPAQQAAGAAPNGVAPGGVSPGDATPEQAGAVLEVAGLDMSELSKEYAKDGKLSEDSYQELQEAGFPRSVVDAYIRGVKQSTSAAVSLAEKDVSEIMGLAGGEKNYKNMMEWASTSFSKEEKAAYNRAVNMGDKHVAKFAVQGLVSRYEAEYGREPKLVGGGGRAVEEKQDAFKNRADMVSAMSDKRYGRDPDYTREVERRVVNSKLMSSARR